MLKIGLTGVIGSGKTTAAHYFAELGATIIDADVIARDIVNSNTTILQKIVDHFGKNILTLENTLNRHRLRELIFSDEKQRIWLEGLLHPLIRTEIQRRMALIQTPYCLLVIPLLLEKQMQDWVDRILVVDINPALQKQRLQQRDKIDDKTLNAILATQLSREQHLAEADDIIHNDGDLIELKKQVKKLHEKYLQKNN